MYTFFFFNERGSSPKIYSIFLIFNISKREKGHFWKIEGGHCPPRPPPSAYRDEDWASSFPHTQGRDGDGLNFLAPPNSITLCLFVGKPSIKIVFHIFQCLVAHKKPGQWKTIFGQQKTLIKIRLIFYRLFSKFFF